MVHSFDHQLKRVMKIWFVLSVFFLMSGSLYSQDTLELVTEEETLPSIYELLEKADNVYQSTDSVFLYVTKNPHFPKEIEVVIAKGLRTENEQMALFMATKETQASQVVIYRHSMTEPDKDFLLLKVSPGSVILDTRFFAHVSVDLRELCKSDKMIFTKVR